MAIRGILEGWRDQASGQKVYCLHCGATNSSGQSTCLNCEKELETPAPFAINLLGTLIKPAPTLRRIAGTAPIMQAVLVVLLAFSVAFVLSTFYILTQYQWALTNLEKLLTDPKNAAIRDNILRISEAPVPGPFAIGFTLLYSIITWLFYSAAVFYTGRLFFRNDAYYSFYSIMAIVGFSRLTSLALLLVLIPGTETAVFDTLSISGVISYGTLIWQVILILLGVRAATGMTTNRTSLMIMVPTLLFMFLGLAFPL